MEREITVGTRVVYVSPALGRIVFEGFVVAVTKEFAKVRQTGFAFFSNETWVNKKHLQVLD